MEQLKSLCLFPLFKTLINLPDYEHIHEELLSSFFMPTATPATRTTYETCYLILLPTTWTE